MELIPAIDLMGGQVVRLRQGRFDHATVYSDDPVAVARQWVEQGAPRLHLVDLDGARSGSPTAWDAIDAVVRAVPVPVQVAGGMRTPAAVARALRAGADRVVLGTVLLEDEAAAAGFVTRFGRDRVVVALDVRDGRAVGHAWVDGAAGVPAAAVARRLREHGFETFAVTAIARDGLLAGPDLALLQAVGAEVGTAKVIASGGVSTLADVRALAAAGFGGAILGRALYEGHVRLPGALGAATAAAGHGGLEERRDAADETLGPEDIDRDG